MPLRRPRPGEILALLLLLLAPAALPAQAGIPGQRLEPGRGMEAEYLTYAMRGVRQTLGAWSGAWRAGDPARLAGLYASDARLVAGDGAGPLRGRAEIERYWAAQRPATREVTLEMDDFDVSSQIAFVQGAYELVRTRPDGAEERTGGVHLTVLVMEGRSWRIRSQVFRPGE